MKRLIITIIASKEERVNLALSAEQLAEFGSVEVTIEPEPDANEEAGQPADRDSISDTNLVDLSMYCTLCDHPKDLHISTDKYFCICDGDDGIGYCSCRRFTSGSQEE